MNMQPQKPKVGVGVMVWKDGKILLGKRLRGVGAHEYSFPGGKLKYGESIHACAARETKEECGLEITNIRFLSFSNTPSYGGEHYVTVNVVADWKAGEPQTLEPDTLADWGWYAIDAPPEPLYLLSGHSIEAFRTGKTFFDSDL